MLNIDTQLLTKVSERGFWLLIHIAKRLNAENRCWPSNKTICKDTGWSLNTLQKIKKELIDGGLVQVTARTSAGQTSNFYKITTPFIGVYMRVDELPEAQETPTQKMDTPPNNILDTPPTQILSNEVLTSEVLTTEQIPLYPPAGDDVPGKTYALLNALRVEHSLGKRPIECTPERKRAINARIKATKASYEDIECMLRYKFKEWANTDMEKYLRPQTLFAPLHFLDYIEAARAAEERGDSEEARLGRILGLGHIS